MVGSSGLGAILGKVWCAGYRPVKWQKVDAFGVGSGDLGGVALQKASVFLV